MRLGALKVGNPFVQAPMAGWTDAPFRTVARRFHRGLLFTEMVSAEALCRGNRRTLEYCRIEEVHRPVALQLVGHDPDRMAEAARLAERFRPDVIDINAGCPDRRIVSQGAGGALLRKPEKLAAMVSKVVKASGTPVSVKVRLGWDRDDSLPIGRMLEGTGIAFLTLNGYQVAAGFSGPADRRAQKRVVEALDLPVVVNGGIRGEEDAVEMLRSTGAEGAMLGRATRGRPDRPMTCFSQLKEGKFRRMDLQELKMTVREHARLECGLFGEERGMRRMRKHLHWYLKAAGADARPLGVDGLSTLEGLGSVLERAWPVPRR